MKKVGLVILVGLFILSCTPLNPENINQVSAVTEFVRSGVQGVDMRFVQNLPPRQIYDTADLFALLELRNLGNYDLGRETFQQCVVQLGGFDPSIIRGINERQSCGDLPGKSEFVVDGGFSTVEFASSSIILPQDVDKYEPPLVATACYEYKTVAAPQVCIDPDFFEITSSQRACDVRDFGLGGGQGGPVGVTYVNVDMVGSRAQFQIEVANLGSGRVVSPRASITQCPGGLRYKDFDEVQFQVELSGARLVRCAPSDQFVRLGDGRGRFVCTFDVGNVPAYETPMRIELNYNYMQSIRTPVEIIRTPE